MNKNNSAPQTSEAGSFDQTSIHSKSPSESPPGKLVEAIRQKVAKRMIPAALALTPALTSSTVTTPAEGHEACLRPSKESEFNKSELNNRIQLNLIRDHGMAGPDGGSAQYEHSWLLAENLNLDWMPIEIGGVRTPAELKPEDTKVKFWAGSMIGASYEPSEDLSIHMKLGPRLYYFGYYPSNPDLNSNLYVERSWGVAGQLGVRYFLSDEAYIGLTYTPDWPAGGEPGELKPAFKVDTSKVTIGNYKNLTVDDVISHEEAAHVDFKKGRLHHSFGLSFGFRF